MKQHLYVIPLLVTTLIVFSCDSSNNSPEGNIISDDPVNEDPINEPTSEPPPLSTGQSFSGDFDAPYKENTIYNAEAPIPSQCYTRTEGVFNPCYTCHQTYSADQDRPNIMNDGDLQGDYNFSDVGVKNHWINLFEDRSAEVAAISDQDIINYINQDNFSNLAARLRAENWSGFIPELENLAAGAIAFNERGFALDGSGWVAFNYKPLPSTFWPTNGSTDDVLIKLPEKFRQTDAGDYSEDLYLLNLSIAEMAIKDIAEISIPEMDENELGLDLDNNGLMGLTTTLIKPEFYLGQAADTEVVKMLYPEGTSFLHTVRYIGVNEDSEEIYVPGRMKEVRYMNKHTFYPAEHLASKYINEEMEKDDGLLPNYTSDGEDGINNGFGWHVIGYIENAEGELRVQNYEENLFCMGCHTAIGATIDQTFAFPRKVTGAEGWGYIEIKGQIDAPNVNESRGEIETYLDRVGGGSEFRNNEEMQARFFQADGSLNQEAVDAAEDVYDIIAPTKERALELNKAFKVIVEAQDYIHGRDATVVPPENVFDEVDPETVPIQDEEKRYQWDIRLNWDTE